MGKNDYLEKGKLNSRASCFAEIDECKTEKKTIVTTAPYAITSKDPSYVSARGQNISALIA